MNFNILLAEDDEDIVKLIKLYLENDSFNIFWAKDGIEALELFRREKIDLALVDIMMPRMNGYELTKNIRAKSNIPIVILSAAHLDSDKILGLNLGADDYLVKPFNPLELIARINAQLRRFYHLGNANTSGTSEDGKIVVGDLTLDTHTLTLEKRGEPISLTATEYKILAMLMKSPGRVFTKMQIYEEVNGDYYATDDNTMMVHISNLRDKIEDDAKNPRYIKTVRGLGYKIERQ
ncbi:MAG: response regulator transcription factor [Clostridia bacterium]|nr:response regulator transcription factor [Clostridia bacterium]